MRIFDFGDKTLEQVVERVNLGSVQGFEHDTPETLTATQ